jgi:hypothetical protein
VIYEPRVEGVIEGVIRLPPPRSRFHLCQGATEDRSRGSFLPRQGFRLRLAFLLRQVYGGQDGGQDGGQVGVIDFALWFELVYGLCAKEGTVRHSGNLVE